MRGCERERRGLAVALLPPHFLPITITHLITRTVLGCLDTHAHKKANSMAFLVTFISISLNL